MQAPQGTGGLPWHRKVGPWVAAVAAAEAAAGGAAAAHGQLRVLPTLPLSHQLLVADEQASAPPLPVVAYRFSPYDPPAVCW